MAEVAEDILTEAVKASDENNRIYIAEFDKYNKPGEPIISPAMLDDMLTDSGMVEDLSKKGIRNIKSCLAKEIFKNDLIQIYKEQTDIRDKLKASSKDIAEKLIENIMKGNFQNENMERLLFDLNDKLKRTSGKKVYGYLKPEVKLIVNQIVDELEKNENIKSLYALWYEQKDKITSNYTNEKLKRIPLSENKEFNIILQNRENYLKYSAAMSAMRLFGYMGNLFGKKFNTDKSKTGFRIDKKQYRQIEEKKMAHGLKQ